MKYDSRMKYKWDNENVMDYAVKQAEKRGEQRGEQRSDQKNAIALNGIAKALKKEGLSSEFIAKTTDLSIEEIVRL